MKNNSIWQICQISYYLFFHLCIQIRSEKPLFSSNPELDNLVGCFSTFSFFCILLAATWLKVCFVLFCVVFVNVDVVV